LENSDLIPALVLSAGHGTRLRPLTSIRAKAALPVNGEPLVRRVIRWLVSEGAADLVVNLHHRPQTITREIGDGANSGARVRYSWEDPVLGSAGGPRHALPLLGPTFLLVNGDTLTDVDLGGMIAAHREAKALVTMALIPNPRPDKYGGVQLSEAGRVTGFTRAGAAAESFHFIGVQVAEAQVFADLEDGVPAETVNTLYPRLIAERPRSILGFVSDASFRDIGTPRDYLETSVGLAKLEGDRLADGARVVRPPSARLVRTAVWDDVVIGHEAELIDCVVADGVRLPDGARYEGCAIVPATTAEGVPLSPDRASGDRIEGGLLIRPIV
jgi:NDP-sugar pyrophosphorylase family protein